MVIRRYLIIRGVLLDDPRFTVSADGSELARLRIGVRMPDGLVEPVDVEAGDVMPGYCRAHGLVQGNFIVVSGWGENGGNAEAGIRRVTVNTSTAPLVRADMLAADTSFDWDGTP